MDSMAAAGDLLMTMVVDVDSLAAAAVAVT